MATGGEIQKLADPAYLMTLEEYQQKVTPILKEYYKFIRKNAEYLVKADYYGLFCYTYPELVHDFKAGTIRGQKFYRQKGVNDKDTAEEVARDGFATAKLGWNANTDNYVPPPVPKGVTEKKNEYIATLSQFFTDDEINRRIEKDETKNNKRAVRRAIDNGTYKKILEGGTATIEQVEKVAASVGVRLPKKIFDPNAIKAQEREDLYAKLYRSTPSVNRDILKKLVEEVKETFKPLEEKIYASEMKRYNELIKETLKEQKISSEALSSSISFWYHIFNVGKEWQEWVPYHSRKWNTERKKEVTYYGDFQLKTGWEERLDKYVREYVEGLKVKFIQTIITKFDKITLPIEKFEQIHLSVGAKGFEGQYGFTFNDGSFFVFKTEAIGAGGYNIQVFHFRYITDFTDVKMPGGKKPGDKFSFMAHFSSSEELKSINDPYKKVAASQSVEEIIETLYNYIKAGYLYPKAHSPRKFPKSLSYKQDTRLASRGIYFEKPNTKGELMDLPQAQEKALRFLQEMGVKRN